MYIFVGLKICIIHSSVKVTANKHHFVRNYMLLNAVEMIKSFMWGFLCRLESKIIDVHY